MEYIHLSTRFRTLIDRILGMRMVYAQKSLNRQVSFEFLNRQMVWHAFTVSREGDLHRHPSYTYPA